jgi:hypothetical protein
MLQMVLQIVQEDCLEQDAKQLQTVEVNTPSDYWRVGRWEPLMPPAQQCAFQNTQSTTINTIRYACTTTTIVPVVMDVSVTKAYSRVEATIPPYIEKY